MHKFLRILPVLLVLLVLGVSQAAALSDTLVCGIVATEDLELRPLELNQRDPVSVLDLVYEGLFYLDDDYAPQPELAYSYSFISEGRRLEVKLRDGVTFHNGQALTAHDVVATPIAAFTIPRSTRSSPGRPRTITRCSSRCAGPATARFTR